MGVQESFPYCLEAQLAQAACMPIKAPEVVHTLEWRLTEYLKMQNKHAYDMGCPAVQAGECAPFARNPFNRSQCHCPCSSNPIATEGVHAVKLPF